MKCTKCNHGWQPDQNNLSPVCPVCSGNAKPDNLSEGLWLVYKLTGAGMLQDEKRLLGVFTDIAPELKKERNLLDLFIKAHGPSRLAQAASQNEIDTVCQALIRDLNENYGMAEEKSTAVCQVYLSALNGHILGEMPMAKPIEPPKKKKSPVPTVGPVNEPTRKQTPPSSSEESIETPLPPQSFQKTVRVRRSGFLLWQEILMIYLAVCMVGAVIVILTQVNPLIAVFAAVLYYLGLHFLGKAFKKSNQKKLQAQNISKNHR